jgi:ZIP family zinc transporter
MFDDQFLYAFGLTVFAGLATGIGSALAFFTTQTNTKFLSFSLGFSAGVMIYVSFVEIFKKGQDSLVAALGTIQGNWLNTGAFFAGIALIAIIDRFVPSFENPHEIRKVEDLEKADPDAPPLEFKHLHRVGVMTAVAISIHNFPEGLATFVSALDNPVTGLSIAIAIAIHNIPEGIAVSLPIYYATGSRKKAFVYSFLSGVSEPIGALIGYTILRPFLNQVVTGCIFGLIAGIMVFISLDSLLPTARRYGEHHLSVYGLVSGMGVMAISLLLFL